MTTRRALERRLDPQQRYGLRLTLFAVAVTLVAIPFGVLLDQVLRDGPLTELDTSAANHLHDRVREEPRLVDVLQAISFLGKPVFFYVLCTPIALLLVLRGRARLAVYLVTTSLVAGVTNLAVKAAVSRPRPSLDDPVATASGQSFPSGHAMSATAVYGALLLIFLPAVSPRWRRTAVAAVVGLVLAIGATRLALGVHYISDVLGGFVLGLGWLVAATAAFEIWRVERGRRPTRPLEEGIEPEAAGDLRAS